MELTDFFTKLFEKKSTKALELPLSLRNEFKEPAGKLYKSTGSNSAEFQVMEALKEFHHQVVTVGDVCTKTLVTLGFFPSVAIIDGKTLRDEETEEIFPRHDPRGVITAQNPPAQVTYEAVKAIERALILNTELKDVIVVRINGEEDLLVLPAVILAPKNAVVIYGQPGEGMVLIKVEPKVQERFAGLLSCFK